MSDYRAGSTLSSTGQHSAESPVLFPLIVGSLFVVMIGMATLGVTSSHMNFDYSPIARGAVDQAGQLRTNVFVPSLMFFTFGSTLVGAVVAFMLFLRRRSNRAAAKEVLGS